MSHIQDKSRFVVTVFGDSKRIYDVKGALVSLILPDFKSSFTVRVTKSSF